MTRKYKTNYRTHRDLKRFHVDFSGALRTLKNETFKEELTRKIAEKESFIREYPNYTFLCDEAAVAIKDMRQELSMLGMRELSQLEGSDMCMSAQLSDAGFGMAGVM